MMTKEDWTMAAWLPVFVALFVVLWFYGDEFVPYAGVGEPRPHRIFWSALAFGSVLPVFVLLINLHCMYKHWRNR